jgi:hypothetical protein
LLSERSLHEDTFNYFELTDEIDPGRAEAFWIYFSSILPWPSNGNDLDETLQGFEGSYQSYFSRCMNFKSFLLKVRLVLFKAVETSQSGYQAQQQY